MCIRTSWDFNSDEACGRRTGKSTNDSFVFVRNTDNYPVASFPLYVLAAKKIYCFTSFIQISTFAFVHDSQICRLRFGCGFVTLSDQSKLWTVFHLSVAETIFMSWARNDWSQLCISIHFESTDTVLLFRFFHNAVRTKQKVGFWVETAY